MKSPLSETEVAELEWAYAHLEHPSLAARLSSVLAVPIEEGFKLLPTSWRKNLDVVVKASIMQALKPGVLPLNHRMPQPVSNLAHKLLVAGTGAAGGFLGPATLLAELPVTTCFMLHSIADIARSEGEDLGEAGARLACAQVFALGGRTREDDAADLGYYGLRITLGMHFERDILAYAAGASGPHIPAAINVIRSISSRFGVVVSDHAAGRMVPVVGAISGAALNLIFMKHFQDVAKGHFIVRRLERQHGVEAVKKAYKNCEAEDRESREYSPVVGW
ncbi:MAG: EcsC family protein [Gammaproteobacteria bacterium]|nr:EcsC family protein [Gammaproteobacteria bacterium]